MIKKFFGNNGPLVSNLCFGTLPMGPLGSNMSLKDGSQLIKQALGGELSNGV